MHPDLEKLVRLQQAETALRRAGGELAEVPRVRAAADLELSGQQERVAAAREALAASQRQRRQGESDLQALEAKRSKYKGQLMEVKTNKEYTAMLHEIEAVEREIRGVEDQVLVEMERAEGLAAEVKAEELRLKEAEERHRGEVRELEQRTQTLEREFARIAAERDGVAATIPEDLVTLFQRVAQRRGVAVAEARDGTCDACHFKIRPQLYLDVKRNDAIVQCAACGRILHYPAPVPTVSTEP